MIEVKEVWLSREPMDMRAGPDTALARVIKQFGKATPHTAYVFANKRGNRVKVLIIDAFGVWLAARRLHQGKFVWSRLREGAAIALVAFKNGEFVRELFITQTQMRNRIVALGGAIYAVTCGLARTSWRRQRQIDR